MEAEADAGPGVGKIQEGGGRRGGEAQAEERDEEEEEEALLREVWDALAKEAKALESTHANGFGIARHRQYVCPTPGGRESYDAADGAVWHLRAHLAESAGHA